MAAISRGQTAMTPEVGAVRERFVVDLDDPVVDSEGVGDRDAHRCSLGQHPDPVVLLAEIQLAHGADHSE